MEETDRINARLDETTQQQLRYLVRTTGHSISHVVRESVAHYYAQVRKQRAPSRLAAMAGRWSSAVAPAVPRSPVDDPAARQREVVLAALEAKYPQHFGHRGAGSGAAAEPKAAAKPVRKR